MTLNRTAQDVITRAYKGAGILGVGQSLLGEDISDGFAMLQEMLAEWGAYRWNVWHLIDVAFTGTGAASYSIGTGQTINTPRPDRLENGCFVRLLTNITNQVDLPLALIEAREDYNRITLKSLATQPQYIFYDAAWPSGVVYPWPAPSSLYEVHLALKDNLQSLALPSDTLSMPDNFLPALHYNLAMRLRGDYGLPEKPFITKMARATLNSFKMANVSVPRLQVPADLTRAGIYDPYSDQIK